MFGSHDVPFDAHVGGSKNNTQELTKNRKKYAALEFKLEGKRGKQVSKQAFKQYDIQETNSTINQCKDTLKLERITMETDKGCRLTQPFSEVASAALVWPFF